MKWYDILDFKKSSEAREAHGSGVNKARLSMSWKLMKLSDGWMLGSVNHALYLHISLKF